MKKFSISLRKTSALFKSFNKFYFRLFNRCDKTFANGSNCRSHKKKSHPHELSAFEASGKSSNAAPNIPRLEQLQPKAQQQLPQMITVDGTDMILHQMPSDIKSELPSLHVEAFQVQHLVQSRHLEPQSQ